MICAVYQIPVSSENQATFVCPRCGWSRALNVSRYLDIDQEVRLKIHCKCRHVCIIALDRRRHFRKETDLYGSFTRVQLPGSFFQEKSGAFGEMIVTDLSRGGLRFRPFRKADLTKEEQVRVDFHLDDLNHSRILKQVAVKSVNGHGVGAAYLSVEATDFSDRAIAYYLLTYSASKSLIK